MEECINNEIAFLSKISSELNDSHDRCRGIMQFNSTYSNDILQIPVLISRITSLTEMFENRFKSLCELISKSNEMSNLSAKQNNSVLNLTWQRKIQIFSEQISNYKYLLTKLFRESREMNSFEVKSYNMYSKFKNRNSKYSDFDFSTLYTSNLELEDTLFQGINTVSLLSSQNKVLSGIKKNVSGLLRMASVSDAMIVKVHKCAKINQRIITFGFFALLLFLFFVYYYF